MEIETLYDILEVDESASLKDIKSSYRRLALIWHPDRNPKCGKLCEERFNKITEAKKILTNIQKREEYDRVIFLLNIYQF